MVMMPNWAVTPGHQFANLCSEPWLQECPLPPTRGSHYPPCPTWNGVHPWWQCCMGCSSWSWCCSSESPSPPRSGWPWWTAVPHLPQVVWPWTAHEQWSNSTSEIQVKKTQPGFSVTFAGVGIQIIIFLKMFLLLFAILSYCSGLTCCWWTELSCPSKQSVLSL